MFTGFWNPFTSPPPITNRVEPRPMHVTLKINFDGHRQPSWELKNSEGNPDPYMWWRPLIYHKLAIETGRLRITDLSMHLNSL